MNIDEEQMLRATRESQGIAPDAADNETVRRLRECKPAPSLPTQEDVARVIDREAVLGVVDQIRHQNWKSGGVLTMDRDEAADAILALMGQTGDTGKNPPVDTP